MSKRGEQRGKMKRKCRGKKTNEERGKGSER